MQRILRLANGQSLNTDEPQVGWYLITEESDGHDVCESWQLLNADKEAAAKAEAMRVFRTLPEYRMVGTIFPRRPFVLFWAGRAFANSGEWDGHTTTPPTKAT